MSWNTEKLELLLLDIMKSTMIIIFPRSSNQACMDGCCCSREKTAVLPDHWIMYYGTIVSSLKLPQT